MGLFRSFLRFIRTIFGLAEGTTERATDALLTSSADAIRSQFRKTREDWLRDYNQIKDAITELTVIFDQHNAEMQKLSKQSNEIDAKMVGAINLFKKSGDESLRIKYGQLAEEKTQLEARIDDLEKQLDDEHKVIENYKEKLTDLQTSIENLKQEEAATVADIVSSRKINELNAKLQGLTTDTQGKNLEAIREARRKAKATAKLNSELAGDTPDKLEEQLLTAGASSKHLDAFDAAVKLDKMLPPVIDVEHLDITDEDKDGVKALDSLFQ